MSTLAAGNRPRGAYACSVSNPPFQRAPLWWRGAIIYQICPRSFQDTRGEGIGDLRGILQRLPYLASLGIDAIWITPFFRSPMEDFGYDIEDHRVIDPLFGTLQDFDTLLQAAHAAGLKVVIDLVLSHTSHRHPWFITSRRDRGNERADWYVWADAKPDGTPPNNWLAMFGGSAWTWEPRRGQYYFHNFLPSQPDLNLHNVAVQDALLDICRYWLERGVDGFRLDACNFYTHDPLLRDNPPRPAHAPPTDGVPPNMPYNRQLHRHDKSQPQTLAFLRRLRSLADTVPGTALLGEIADDHSLRTMEEYAGPGGPLHTAYSFALLGPRLDPELLLGAFAAFHDGRRQGWPAWAFSNHDVCRVISRWGGATPTRDFAKVLIALLCTLRGTVFLYQGEELGLPQARVPFEHMRDPFGLRFYPDFPGRDGARTPMPWDDAQANAGFSSAAQPWLPIPVAHLALSVSRQEQDRHSVLQFTRAFLRWRAACRPLIEGDIAFVPADPGVHAFLRMHATATLLVALNCAGEERRFQLPPGKWERLRGHGLQEGRQEDGALVLPAWGGYVARLAGSRLSPEGCGRIEPASKPGDTA